MMRGPAHICLFMAVGIAGWKCPEQTFKGAVVNVTYHHAPGAVYWKEGTDMDPLTGTFRAGVGKPSGWTAELYDIIAEKLGFEFNVRPARSGGIANVSNSAFTSTTYDIGQGINDIAISPFYETAERRTYSDVRACMCACAHVCIFVIRSSSRLLHRRTFVYSVKFKRRLLNGTR